MEAQKWLERRRLRWGFVIFTLTCLGVTLQLMWLMDMLVRDLDPENLPDDLDHLRQTLFLFGRSWFVLAQLPLLPLLIPAGVGGSSLGRLSTSGDSLTNSPFLATRAMATADMVAAKLLTCARGIVILWAIMYLAGLLWAVCLGRVGEMTEYLVARTGSASVALLVLAAGMIVLPAISWLWLISGMGAKIIRWPLLEIVPAIFSMSLLIIPGLLILERLEPWRPLFGALVATALVGKVLAVCWVVNRLRREGLVHNRTIVWALAGWVALAGALLSIGFAAFSIGPLIVGVAVLLLPLARPLATPLGLARQRTQ